MNRLLIDGTPAAVVPVGPTDEMYSAGDAHCDRLGSTSVPVWEGMLAATDPALTEAVVEMVSAVVGLNAELDAYWNDPSQAGSRPPEAYIQLITSAQIRCAAALARITVEDSDDRAG